MIRIYSKENPIEPMKNTIVFSLLISIFSTSIAQNLTIENVPRGGVNQRFLDSIGQFAKELTFPLKIASSSPVVLPNYFAIREDGKTHGGKKDVLRGKLFAVSDSGVFLYRSAEAEVHYIPFSKMDYLMKGKPIRKRIVGRWTADVVGWSIGIAALAWDDYYIGGPGSLAIGATLGFFAGGVESLFWTAVYGIRKRNPNILFAIHGDAGNGLKFRAQLKENHLGVWGKVDASNFTSGWN